MRFDMRIDTEPFSSLNAKTPRTLWIRAAASVPHYATARAG
jgi:hypothetical protein